MNLSIKSENPAICLKEELENLKEGLQDIDFEKYLKNYYYVEQNKSYDLLVSKFWGGFWIFFDQLNSLALEITDPSFSRACNNQVLNLRECMRRVEEFTRRSPNLTIKGNNSETQPARSGLDKAIESTCNLYSLGEQAKLLRNEHKDFSIYLLEKVSELKNSILSSPLKTALKEKLIYLLEKIEKLIQADFLDQERIKNYWNEFYFQVSEEKDNAENSPDEQSWLKNFFSDFIRPASKFIGKECFKTLVSEVTKTLLQLTNGQ